MTREIYEAMKSLITKITPESEDYRSLIEDYDTRDWHVAWGIPFYRLNADGLNQGLSEFDEDSVCSFVHPMATSNMWNVCQRFYSFIKYYKDIDQRLLGL